jgi:hypothetical protein
MNLQLQIVATNAKVRGTQTAWLFTYWSRVFSDLGDTCTLMSRGSYASCAPLLRGAIDCLAAQQALLADDTREYDDWFNHALSQDADNKALAIDTGRFRAASVLIGDDDLGAVYRLLTDLSMPHFGTTLWLTSPEAGLQKAPLAFAESAFHLAWAELIAGWSLRLASAQLEISVDVPFLTLTRTLTADAAAVQRDVRAALGNRRRCYVEADGDRFVFHNFRRSPTGQPKRVVLA